MAELLIRYRQPGDLESCVKVLRAVHAADRYPMNWPKDPVRWLSPADGVQAWVAVDGGTDVVGHVVVQGAADASAKTASVVRLFVDPKARGRGIGARLLDHAGQWATERGIGLVLEVTADERSSAVALYERSGWRRTGTREANWTTPEGKPVMLHSYVLPEGTRQG